MTSHNTRSTGHQARAHNSRRHHRPAETGNNRPYRGTHRADENRGPAHRAGGKHHHNSARHA